MRETSIKIYDQIEKSGLLSKRRLLVYRILTTKRGHVLSYGLDKKNLGMTAHELRSYAEKFMNIEQSKAEHLPKRLSELEQMGCVDTVGTRKCQVTGNNALVWDVNGNMPNPEWLRKENGSKTRIERKKKAINLLNTIEVNYDNGSKISGSDFSKLEQLIAAI